MSIQFDPKVKGQTAPAQTEEKASSTLPEVTEALERDPQTVLSDMDLLFSGARNRDNFQKEHPIELTSIPDFTKNVPGVLKTVKGIDEVIHKYEAAKRSLLQRKENFETALKHYLVPEEAIDIYRRLAELEGALLKTEQNLQEAIHQKGQLEEEQRAANRPPPDSDAQARRFYEQADNVDLDRAREEYLENGPDTHIDASRIGMEDEV